jgi:chromate reductase
MNTFTLNKPEVFIGNSGAKFNAEGELTDEVTAKFIVEQITALRTLAERVKPR